MHSWLEHLFRVSAFNLYPSLTGVMMESGPVNILRELYQTAFKSLRFQFKISVHEPILPSQVT